MTSEREKKIQERENLRNIIVQWNANRLDLFELSEPNEELEFHGVMRFYFQDSGQKVATKCIRVSSTAASIDVIHTLIEKFRPDIRMLSIPEYAIYEIHENGEERKLADEEKPLLVQLNWHKDDREGRFLLRRMDEKSILPITMDPEARSFRRKLSKREKKEKKKKEKKERLRESQSQENRKDGIAEKLYSELPETSFTRSISNPEAVMRRRRQQKLEKKLQQFRQEGGPDGGGTLRIFGETLNKDVPYKTLLLSTRDSAAYVVKEILDKYGMDGEEATHYCLVQVIIPHPMGVGLDGDRHEYHRGTSIREYILDDDDCPLVIEKQHNRSKGILTFHIRRRPADYQPRKRKKKSKPVKGELDNGYKSTEDALSEKLPFLLELNPDGSEVIPGPPKKHCLYLNVTEIGSERSSSAGGQHLQLFGPNVQSRHCVIAHTEGIVTVTPSSRDAETYVNGVRIYETTILEHQVVVRFGKLHTFRFVDPLHDERRRMSPDPRQAEFMGRKEEPGYPHSLPPGSYETTFDAEGNVETVSTHSRDDRMSRKSDDLHSHRSFGGREGAQSRGEKHDSQGQQRRGNEPILPAVLEFWDEGEDAFLNAVISQIEASQVQFKLAPTYILYMAARYRASTYYRPEGSPGDRAHRLTALMIKIAGHIHQVIQDQYRDGTSLAFWLANASELLHFLKQDRHVCAYTLDAQDLLAESVQLAFRSLVTCQQVELQSALPGILEDRDDLNEEEGTTAGVLAVLSGAMSLLRRCRVNAALTIQLFSQLFHHVNMWLFNRVVDPSQQAPNFCSCTWGISIKRRLVRIEVWAEKQGLELAADCHLSRIVQAAHLLQSPKNSADDIAAISSSCFKLNSLQLLTLLERYQPLPDEPPIPHDLIESVVKVAQSTADELARSDGREVRLEEDPDLQLPFLLPEDGYSCDIVRGVPAGLQDYLQPLLHAGLCRLTVQPTSSGYWTIYMSDQDIGKSVAGTRSPSVQSSHQGDGEASGRGSAIPLSEPEVLTMKLQKSNSGMGLSIVAARGVGQDKLGIYVKSVVKGGAADQDGRLQAGDQLLKVDGHSLVGISQEKAAELMTRTGPVVTLEVAKQGAIYHGLAALLSQPSPVMQRGPRRMSERDIPGRIVQDQNHITQPRMQGSKSVPSLNSGQTVPDGTVGAPPGQNHEIYNPGYSRTSSTASIPKSTGEQHYPGADHHSRHKSAPNDPQYDPRYGYSQQGCPAPNLVTIQPGQTGGPPLQGGPPNYSATNGRSQQSHAEERHYQNISMYQQPSAYGQYSRTSQSQIQHQPPQRPLHASHSSLLRPDHHHHSTQQQPQAQSPMDRSRPLSTLVSPREQEQYVNSLNYSQQRPGESPGPQPGSPLQKGAPQQPWAWQEAQRASANYGHRGEFRNQPDLPEESELPRSAYLNGSYDPRHQQLEMRQHSQMDLRPQSQMDLRQQSQIDLRQQADSRHQIEARLQHTLDQRPQPDKRQHSIDTRQQQQGMDMRQQLIMDPRQQQGVDPRQQQGVDPRQQQHSMDLRQQQHGVDPRQQQHGMDPRQQQHGMDPRQQQQGVDPRQQQQGMDPRQQQQGMDPRQQQQQGMDPRQQQQGMDPRQQQQGMDPRQPQQGIDPRQPQQGMDPRQPQQGMEPRQPQQGLDPRLQQQSMDPRQPYYIDPRQQQHNVDARQQQSIDSRQGVDPRHQNVDSRLQQTMDPRQQQHLDARQHLTMDSRQRDLIRQEAKMEEMREEVRRREERELSGYSARPVVNGPSRPSHSHGPGIPAQISTSRASGPPTVPKPRQPHPRNYEGMDPLVVYRDSPPPPPPPSNTHPLLQQGGPIVGSAPAVSYRYGPSGYPPRPAADSPIEAQRMQPQGRPTENQGSAYGKAVPGQKPGQPRIIPDVVRLPQVSQTLDKKEFGITSPSPWEREEKEKATSQVASIGSSNSSLHLSNTQQLLHKQKLDEARRIRDNEIQELEGLPSRSQKQEDRLRTLRLEQEFQRRAEESHGDDEEDDDELLDRAENRERVLRMQEDLARTRQRRLEFEQEQQRQMQQIQQRQIQQHMHDEWLKKQTPQDQQQPTQRGITQVEEQEGRLRHLRIEEVTRKKELEATQEAEEKLLREARRRQEEDHQGHEGYLPLGTQQQATLSGPQRLESLLLNPDVPPALPTSPPPVEPESNNFIEPGSGSQRLDNLLLSSNYPDRSERQTSGRSFSGVLRNGDIGHPPLTMPKKVSFHDTRLETEIVGKESKGNADDSYTLDDIDEALDGPAGPFMDISAQSSILNISSNSAPGVIGAQEVYRDPRQRIEAERYQNNSTLRSNSVGPEKLSFREKMKMFALETGEDETPKDKVKISRAQRDIETRNAANGPPVMQS